MSDAPATFFERYAVRRAVAALLAVSPLVVIAGLGLDAHHRRAVAAREAAAVEALAKRLPSGDLALSGGARWLRVVSLEEPGAAFADGPAMPDPDPAGAAMAPPREVWAGAVTTAPLEIRRNGERVKR